MRGQPRFSPLGIGLLVACAVALAIPAALALDTQVVSVRAVVRSPLEWSPSELWVPVYQEAGLDSQSFRVALNEQFAGRDAGVCVHYRVVATVEAADDEIAGSDPLPVATCIRDSREAGEASDETELASLGEAPPDLSDVWFVTLAPPVTSESAGAAIEYPSRSDEGTATSSIVPTASVEGSAGVSPDPSAGRSPEPPVPVQYLVRIRIEIIRCSVAEGEG